MSVFGFSKISLIVFAFSLIIVMISLVPVVFPALISETVTVSDLEKIGIIPYEEDPYQFGLLTTPLILVNVIIFVTYFFKNKFPLGISKLFKKLLNFQVSKKVSIIIILIVLSMYVIGTVPELDTEEKWKDFIKLEKILDAWSIDTFTPKLGIEPHLRYFCLSSSMILFGSYKVIPFLASIALLITTYLLTKTITKNRFAVLVSMILVLQSNLFLSFDTLATY